ncbi:hypothetical protein DFH06DRAFT_722753 [Mycena polygramma]|nr:hypothetical protein DFH06DRAFT_722753 [Mycena polygramma]
MNMSVEQERINFAVGMPLPIMAPHICIRDRLRHNILPSPAEKSAIRLFLNAKTPEMTKEICNELESLIAPIRRLPVEVLLLIFVHPDIHDHLYTGSVASPSSSSNKPNAALAHTVQPHTPHLAAICSHWRFILLSTPTFWARINTSLTTGRRALSLLRLYLSRSRGVPLSLVLRTGGTHALNPRIVRALTRASERWVSLAVPTGASSTTFLAALPTLRLPRFETLLLAGQAVPLPLSPALAPKLRQISVEFGPDSIIGDAPTLEGGQIERLSAAFVCSGAALCPELLSVYPNVVHLILRAAHTQLAPSTGTAPAPSVRTLTLHGDSMRASRVVELLNVLNLPNLETLELVDVPNCGETANVPNANALVPLPVAVAGAVPNPPVIGANLPLPPTSTSTSPLSSVLEHTRRSGCKIRTLVLQRTPVGCEALKALLEGLSHLERLEISDEGAPSPSSGMQAIEGKGETVGCANVCSEALHGSAKDDECETNLDPALAWLSTPLPPPPSDSSPNDNDTDTEPRALPLPNLHTLTLHDTKPVFSVGALLGMLEARFSARGPHRDADCMGNELTATIDVTLPATRVSAAHLARFAALALPGNSMARLTCLDQRGALARVCDGRIQVGR